MDNFITGNCNCLSAEIFEQNKKKIIDEINIINNKLKPEIEDGFTINFPKKKKDELTSLLLIVGNKVIITLYTSFSTNLIC
jgi:hypothetical protein